jgi:hypothetical protein
VCSTLGSHTWGPGVRGGGESYSVGKRLSDTPEVEATAYRGRLVIRRSKGLQRTAVGW